MPDVLEQTPAATPEVTPVPGESTPAPAKEPEKPAISAADLRKLNQRVEDLETQVRDANQAAIHWHDQYKAASNGTTKEPPPGPEDEAGEDELIDVITTKGTKGLLQTLRKHGVMTEDEVERRVEAKLRGARKEQTLRERYPDLEDHDSEIFKTTAKHYAELESEGVSGWARVTLAAERAELEMRRNGTWKDPQDAEERRSRARAQSPGGNGRGAAPDPNDKTLTAEQKRYADIFEISHDAYQKRAEEGIRFSGLRR